MRYNNKQIGCHHLTTQKNPEITKAFELFVLTTHYASFILILSSHYMWWIKGKISTSHIKCITKELGQTFNDKESQEMVDEANQRSKLIISIISLSTFKFHRKKESIHDDERSLNSSLSFYLSYTNLPKVYQKIIQTGIHGKISLLISFKYNYLKFKWWFVIEW